jgi:predicted nucleic acid-binding Zn ribbon protein
VARRRDPEHRYQRRRPRDQDLSGLVDRLVRKEAMRTRREQNHLGALWEQAAGAAIAAHTRVVDFRQGILRIAVDSSPLLQELVGFHRDRLLKALRENEPPLLVRDLRFQLGQ